MEKKTIGAFIAALRREAGMTQRELAAKLNVSDKAISRWERDETAPDLTLIPVIADIFGVTSDELLRGVRISADVRAAGQENEEQDCSARPEKQADELPEKTLVRFKTRSFISAGLALLAMICAAILFNTLWSFMPPFWLGAAFLTAALMCEIAFIVEARSKMNCEALRCEPDALRCRNKITWIAAGVFMLIFLLFIALTPFLSGFKYSEKLPGWTLQNYLTDDLPLRLIWGLILCGAAAIIIKGRTDARLGRRSLWVRKLAVFLTVVLLIGAFLAARRALMAPRMASVRSTEHFLTYQQLREWIERRGDPSQKPMYYSVVEVPNGDGTAETDVVAVRDERIISITVDFENDSYTAVVNDTAPRRGTDLGPLTYIVPIVLISAGAAFYAAAAEKERKLNKT